MTENDTQVRCHYYVREVNRIGSPRSMLMTADYWQALSEWLMKCYHPIGFPPGVGFGENGVSLVVKSQSVPLDSLDLDLVAEFYYRGNRVRTVSIQTYVSRHVCSSFYSNDTVRFYQEPDYIKAVTKMEKRLKLFALNHHDIGYIASVFAAPDRAHHFWKPAFFGRARGLSM